MASRCLSGAVAPLWVLTALPLERGFFLRPPTEGPLGKRFEDSIPAGPIAAPLLIAQGLGDHLVLSTVESVSFAHHRPRANLSK